MGHQRRTFFTCPLRASVGSSTRQRRRCPSHILHLHEDFHSVQRGRAGARDGPRHCTRDQLLPPAARALLLLCELVWDGQTVTYVQHLVKTQTRLLKSLLFMDAGHSAEISFSRITLCPRYKTHSITGVSVYGHNKYCTTFWFQFTMRTYFDRKPNFTHTQTHTSPFSRSIFTAMQFCFSFLPHYSLLHWTEGSNLQNPEWEGLKVFPCTLAETRRTCLL